MRNLYDLFMTKKWLCGTEKVIGQYFFENSRNQPLTINGEPWYYWNHDMRLWLQNTIQQNTTVLFMILCDRTIFLNLKA